MGCCNNQHQDFVLAQALLETQKHQVVAMMLGKDGGDSFLTRHGGGGGGGSGRLICRAVDTRARVQVII